MASFNVTAEDVSPLISYAPAGAWVDSPPDDTLVSSYSGASLHTTSAQGATATIQFNGTGISIFGGHRPNYGSFTMAVDGITVATGSAASSTPAIKQLLGSASGLPNGPHTAILTNTGTGSAIDVDSIQFETQIGSSGASVTQTIVDDNDAQITYEPSASAWSTSVGQNFFNGTLHFTSTPGAQASLTFSGDAVAVYGTVSPDHADVQVTIDGQSKALSGGSNGLAQVLHAQTLLYFANDLGPSQHVLSLSASGSGQFLDVDSITVYKASGGSAENVPTYASAAGLTSDATAKGGSKHRNSKAGIIAGSVIGSVLLLLLAIFAFLLLRKRQRKRKTKEFSGLPPMTPNLPMQAPDMVEAGLGSGKFYNLPLSPANRKGQNLERSQSMTSDESTAPMLTKPRRPPAIMDRYNINSTPKKGSSFPTRPFTKQSTKPPSKPPTDPPRSSAQPTRPSTNPKRPTGNPTRPSTRPPTLTIPT